jgi:branched-chain amino acid transport system substrate-binding protein
MYKKAGVDLMTTAVPLGTPDLTPQIQAAISSGADEFFIIGDDLLCVNSLKALKTLGFTGKVAINTNCWQSSVAASLGGYNGALLVGAAATTNADAQVKLFHAIAAHYAPSIANPDGGTVNTHYAVVLAFARAMAGISPTQFTSSGIAQQLKTMPAQPLPLLAGQTFQCNRKKSALLQAVCSNATVIETLAPDGTVTKSLSFDATPYL